VKEEMLIIMYKTSQTLSIDVRIHKQQKKKKKTIFYIWNPKNKSTPKIKNK